VIFLFYGGGWLCAVLFTFLSLRARRISSIVIWLFLSLACLLAQRSCWVIASDLATIGNGGQGYDEDKFIPVLDWPIVACAVLFITLLVLAFHRRTNPKKNWYDGYGQVSASWKKGYENARKFNGHK
jgi:hypothetical protein